MSKYEFLVNVIEWNCVGLKISILEAKPICEVDRKIFSFLLLGCHLQSGWLYSFTAHSCKGHQPRLTGFKFSMETTAAVSTCPLSNCVLWMFQILTFSKTCQNCWCVPCTVCCLSLLAAINSDTHSCEVTEINLII